MSIEDARAALGKNLHNIHRCRPEYFVGLIEALIAAKLSPTGAGEDAYIQAITAGCYPLDDAPTPSAATSDGETAKVEDLRTHAGVLMSIGCSMVRLDMDNYSVQSGGRALMRAADRIASLEAQLAEAERRAAGETVRYGIAERERDEALKRVADLEAGVRNIKDFPLEFRSKSTSWGIGYAANAMKASAAVLLSPETQASEEPKP